MTAGQQRLFARAGRIQASVALFTAGKAAFHLNGVWEVPTFNDLEERARSASNGARSRSRS